MKFSFNLVFIIAFLLSLSTNLLAQKTKNIPQETTIVSNPELIVLEDSLQQIYWKMITSRDSITDVQRLQYNQQFIPLFVKALKQKGSFDYPFDSLKGVTKVKAPDNSFRIYTWGLQLTNPTFGGTMYRYYGAIQINNSNELTLIPLLDKSLEISTPEEQTLDPQNWFGVIYYSITMNEHLGRKYYTIFGWDGNNDRSNKKVAEVLYFDENNKVVFGSPMFEVNDGRGVKLKHRFIMEYKKDAKATLNYNAESKLIEFDHLAPIDDKAKEKKDEYVPDGTYEAFAFKNGIWAYINQLPTTAMDKAPVDKPIFNKPTTPVKKNTPKKNTPKKKKK